MSTYQSLQEITVIGQDFTVVGAVQALSVAATVRRRARVLRLSLLDPLAEIEAVAVEDAPITFSWSFDRESPIRLFTGKIVRPETPEPFRVDLFGLDAWRDVMTRRITATFTEQSPADMLRALVRDLGIPTGRIADHPDTLDKLPLYRNTVAEAVEIINRRMGLNHMAFVDEDGVFVWAAPDITQESALTLQDGLDLFDLDIVNRTFSTWAQPLRLGTVVELIDREEVNHLVLITDLDFSQPEAGSQIEARFELIGT